MKECGKACWLVEGVRKEEDGAQVEDASLIVLLSCCSTLLSSHCASWLSYHLSLSSLVGVDIGTLTLEEELRMQEEWHCNERKCTFVILVRNLLLLNLNIGDGDRVPLPLPPKEKVKEEGNQRLHPLLIGWMLHAMIWDVNLLVSNVEEYGNNGNKVGPCLTRIIVRSMQ